MGKVIIPRKDGRTFALIPEQTRSSPLDVPSIKATVSMKELVEIVRKERGRARGQRRRVQSRAPRAGHYVLFPSEIIIP